MRMCGALSWRSASVDSTPFDREQLREWFADLALKGVFAGASVWKYEYIEMFKTVIVDAA